MKRRSPVAVAYLRVSTKEQHQGPKAQRDAIERLASAQSLPVVSWHLDDGISGAAPLEERPALLAALSALRPGDALMVAKRDRLARDTTAVALIEIAVRKSKARILSADGIGNEATPESRLLSGITDSVAEYERQLIRARTKAALQAKKRRNERVGMVPFGFELASDGVHLVPNDREQRIIERVLQLRRMGYGPRRIARACKREGLMSRGRKALQETQIQRLLKRDA